jgi:hypothetical protein
LLNKKKRGGKKLAKEDAFAGSCEKPESYSENGGRQVSLTFYLTPS